MRDLSTFPHRVHAPDPSLGIFETVRIDRGELFDLEQHLERMAETLRALQWGVVPASLADEARIIAARTFGPTRLRIVLTPDGIATFEPEPIDLEATDAQRARGLVLKPVVIDGGLTSRKWLDRRALDTLADGEDEEAVIVDPDGSALETGRSNLFVISKDRVVTPPTDGRILPGVTRDQVLVLLARDGIEVAVESIALSSIAAADGAFATGTVRGVMTVRAVDGIVSWDELHPLAWRAHELLEAARR